MIVKSFSNSIQPENCSSRRTEKMIARKWSLNGNGKQKRVQTLENGEEENAKKELIGYLFQYQMNVIKTLKFRS